jgi:valyl-tRNA synthetase
MRAEGLVIKEEPYMTTIPRSQRGGEIVEPMISTQWFVKIDPLAEKALAAVKNGDIKIVPERFEKVYYNWLENIKDWCISRQLWWGHRIPVWYCDDCGEKPWRAKTRPNAPIAARRTSAKTPTCWIPGSRPGCGRSRPWAGRKRPPITNISTRPPTWRPATISCSSGWRA